MGRKTEEDVDYMAPVSVTVDTATGEVKRVIVLDEDVKPDDNDASPEAREIAESAEWPQWQIGF